LLTFKPTVVNGAALVWVARVCVCDVGVNGWVSFWCEELSYLLLGY